MLPAVVASTMMFTGDIYLFDRSFNRALIFALVVGVGVALAQWWSLRRV
jgi:hypothetical protein